MSRYTVLVKKKIEKLHYFKAKLVTSCRRLFVFFVAIVHKFLHVHNRLILEDDAGYRTIQFWIGWRELVLEEGGTPDEL